MREYKIPFSIKLPFKPAMMYKEKTANEKQKHMQRLSASSFACHDISGYSILCPFSLNKVSVMMYSVGGSALAHVLKACLQLSNLSMTAYPKTHVKIYPEIVRGK